MRCSHVGAPIGTVTAMGLLEDAAAKRDENEKEAADADAFSVKNTPQLVQLPVFQELAALCVERGIQQVVLYDIFATVSGIVLNAAPGDTALGWVFETTRNTRMAFASDGRVWVRAHARNDTVVVGWRKRQHTVVRWAANEPLMTELGAIPAPRMPGISWEMLATAAGAEILAGRGADGFIPMNERLRMQQIVQAERDRN